MKDDAAKAIVTIVDLTHDGVGVADLDGRRIFVADALPGERIEIALRKRRRKVLEAELTRVEVFPFGALLRKGSRLRVYLESPTVLPELWAFVPSPIPAVNTVLHDAGHLSRIVLPVVPNDPQRTAPVGGEGQ